MQLALMIFTFLIFKLWNGRNQHNRVRYLALVLAMQVSQLERVGSLLVEGTIRVESLRLSSLTCLHWSGQLLLLLKDVFLLQVRNTRNSLCRLVSISAQVHVLKPSHKTSLQSKIIETAVPDSVSAVQNFTNATSDVGVETREIVMDNNDAGPKTTKVEETNDHLLTVVKAEKELESTLNKEKMQTNQLKQELTDADTGNTELYKELQSVRGQLLAEQSRCFKLEVDVAELRQKLLTMETLQKDLEILQRQKAAS